MVHGVCLASLLSSALFQTSCGEDSSTLFVDVVTDLVSGSEFVQVRSEVFLRMPMEGVRANASQELTVTEPTGSRVRVAELSGLWQGEAFLRVYLLDAAGEIVAERLTIVQLSGNTTATAVFTRACTGVSCPSPGDSPTAISCLGGDCVEPECSPERPEFCPVAQCTAAEECPAVAACADRRCEFGVCLPLARPQACEMGFACSPEVGCVALPTFSDGGVVDMDGGADAAVLSPLFGDCTETADCAGTLVCEDSTCLRADGAGCAEDNECAAQCIADICSQRSSTGGGCDDDADCEEALVCRVSQCRPVLTNGLSVSVPGSPAFVALTDLNDDAHLDAVVAVAAFDSIVVSLGSGDGTFGPQATYPVGDAPRWIDAGDLNGVGDVDLAVTNRLSDDVSILLGNGDGTFGTATHYPVGDDSSTVAIGDLDGAGGLDLVASARDDNEVGVLLGAGDGTFGPVTGYPVADRPFGVALGDFDADGTLDVAVASTEFSVVGVLLGAGDGTLRGETRFEVGGLPRPVIVADIDADGRQDVAVGNSTSDDVSVLLGRGDGTLVDQVRVAVGNAPRAIATADIDDDGNLDLITGNNASGDVSVRLGRGDGSFDADLTFPIGSEIWGLAVGDLNEDSAQDVLVCHRNTDGMSVLLGVPAASSTAP